jgi:hypothetical protein
MGTKPDGSPDRRHREGAIEAEVTEKVADLVTVLHMSRSETCEQIRAGRIQTVKQGRATFITVGDVAAYVKLLKQEAEAA